jgi:putative transcriptional regulator
MATSASVSSRSHLFYNSGKRDKAKVARQGHRPKIKVDDKAQPPEARRSRMLNILFEFVGGPNDGKIAEGKLGEPSDAERHYLLSNHGRLGQKFAVTSDYSIEVLANGALQEESPLQCQRHHYVVTERLEDEGVVWVRAEYVSEEAASTPNQHLQGQTKAPRNLEGHLLIASPRMLDDWFGRAVVLVIYHGDDGTFGVILNHWLTETVRELWEEVSEIPCENNQPLYLGGPDDGPVMVLHTEESSADVQVLPGVFLAVEQDNLSWIVHQDSLPFRLFVDVTSWEQEQLEEEISQGDWLVLPATKDLIFAEPDNQWLDALREFGRLLYESFGVKYFPEDSTVN